MRNALRSRTTATSGSGLRVPVSGSLPQHPVVPRPLGAWHSRSRVLTKSGAVRRLPSWWVRRSDPGTRGRAGLGRGGGGKEGEGGSGRRLGAEEKVLNPALRFAPPSPLRTLRSNQEEQEEEEDEQNGRHHQPGRKRGRAQAQPARSLLRLAETACPAKVAEWTESPAKEFTVRLDTTDHVAAVGLLAGRGQASSKRDQTQREKPRTQDSENYGPGKVGEALLQWSSGNCSSTKTLSLPEREGEISG